MTLAACIIPKIYLPLSCLPGPHSSFELLHEVFVPKRFKLKTRRVPAQQTTAGDIVPAFRTTSSTAESPQPSQPSKLM